MMHCDGMNPAGNFALGLQEQEEMVIIGKRIG